MVPSPTDAPPEVAAVFASYPKPVHAKLLALRRLILDTADEIGEVGKIEEALRWGQPSYLTTESGTGSTIRIAATPAESAHDYAMYFICNTDLLATFRRQFGDTLTYDGDRALLFKASEPIAAAEVRECIAMALTYHAEHRA